MPPRPAAAPTAGGGGSESTDGRRCAARRGGGARGGGGAPVCPAGEAGAPRAGGGRARQEGPRLRVIGEQLLLIPLRPFESASMTDVFLFVFVRSQASMVKTSTHMFELVLLRGDQEAQIGPFFQGIHFHSEAFALWF